MRPVASILIALALVTGLAGCGAGPLGASARLGAPMASAAAMSEEELAVIREIGLEAHIALAKVGKAYGELRLDTAHGRKLTAEREPVVREALAPLVAELDAIGREIDRRLAVEKSNKLAFLRRELAKRAAAPANWALDDAPSASELISAVATHRVKLGYLLEYAQRKGALVGDAGTPLN